MPISPYKSNNMALLIRKHNSNKEQSKNQKIIKVSPYENPENVMELMARICSAVPNAADDLFWDVINDARWIKKVRGMTLDFYCWSDDFYNENFYIDLDDYCKFLFERLSTRENTKHTKIVVAGGFSSGKSSFLNRLTNSINLLPTGVEPVSVVKTYLYCSRNTNSISVKGVNQKNVLVNLPPGVLQAIQHANKSNIYLASVLDKLFVEIPSKDLNEIVFIDTPGYNNSDKANQSNGKTDRETAQEALDEGNVLFWLVDCERGTTVSNDIEFIKQFNGKKVFIFNKADKKGYQECVKIVDAAAQTLYKEFPKEEIIDILAYSTLDNRIYYSKNKMTLSAIVSEAKQPGNGINEINYWKDLIKKLFDDEISASKNLIKKIEEEYKEKIDCKNDFWEKYRDAKNNKENNIKRLRNALYNNYFFYRDLITKIEEEEDIVIDYYKDKYDKACQDCENALERKEMEQTMVNDLEEYRRIFMTALDLGIRQYQDKNKAISIHKDEHAEPNIFESIKKGDNKSFLLCFEKGVDLSVCNPDGYNPLTLAVQTGNNNMVNFLLDHDADPSIKDRRGYNAFHTAVENQYRDICKMLLDCDPDLIDSTTDSGETIEELAKKQTFSKWIEQEIDNAL